MQEHKRTTVRRNRVFKSLHKPLTYMGVERTLFFFIAVSAVGAFNLFNSLLAGIDQQSQFYDRHAQPIAKEHALEHAGHLTLAVSEISQAQSIAKGAVGTDQGLSL